MDLKQLIDNKIVLLDGAMGTILQRLGVKWRAESPKWSTLLSPR